MDWFSTAVSVAGVIVFLLICADALNIFSKRKLESTRKARNEIIGLAKEHGGQVTVHFEKNPWVSVGPRGLIDGDYERQADLVAAVRDLELCEELEVCAVTYRFNDRPVELFNLEES